LSNRRLQYESKTPAWNARVMFRPSSNPSESLLNGRYYGRFATCGKQKWVNAAGEDSASANASHIVVDLSRRVSKNFDALA
jgi:hypothetical protein